MNDIARHGHGVHRTAICAGNLAVTGRFSSQRPNSVKFCFDIFFVANVNNCWTNDYWCFETPWRLCDVIVMIDTRKCTRVIGNLSCNLYLFQGIVWQRGSRLRAQCWHDDVIKWKHFPRYLSFVRGIHRWTPLTKASDSHLWCFLWSTPE